MKKNIHPKLNKITAILQDGQKFEFLSTMEPARNGENILNVSSSPKTHPAWTGKFNNDIIQGSVQGEKLKKFTMNVKF